MRAFVAQKLNTKITRQTLVTCSLFQEPDINRLIAAVSGKKIPVYSLKKWLPGTRPLTFTDMINELNAPSVREPLIKETPLYLEDILFIRECLSMLVEQ